MIDIRPQPVGVFPFPASNLLLPAVVGDYEEALQSLCKGDLEVELPAEWAFYLAAAKGDVEMAIKQLGSEAGRDSVAIYNAFVLSPTADSYKTVSGQLAGELKELLDVAAFTTGVTDSIASEFSLTGELEGLALATSAAADLELEDFKTAYSKLKSAVTSARKTSPILAATLLSQQAMVGGQLPGIAPASIIQDCTEAIRLAADCKLPMLLAELHTKLGMEVQHSSDGQRGAMLLAVNAYQSALQCGVTRDDQPELFAQLQNNLGLAYLSMPATGASDQLRIGIAIQSFRQALLIYTPDNYSEMWASVSMNLANALQYAPSSHPEDNLVQAVEIYEDILQVRTRAKDPVAYALVLLNQANALAHLGMFKPALEKLAEAYKLFHWYDQIEQANSARDLVELINEQLGDHHQPVELTAE